MDTNLTSYSRLQRLLWTRDYFPLTDEVILIESSFVFDRKHGLPTRMVQVGLTNSILLIAEEKLPSDSPSNKDLQRETSDHNADLELFEMLFLFPLDNVRLSIRTHSEEIGNHVIRLRLCSGHAWYLELTDPCHREDKWHEWVWWIKELDQRRRRKQKEKRHQQRRKHYGRPGSAAHNVGGSASLSSNLTGREHKPLPFTDSNTVTPRARNDEDEGKSQRMPAKSTPGVRNHKQSTARRWVHHFAEHIIDHHDETLKDEDESDDHYHHHDKRNKSSSAGSSNPLLMLSHISHHAELAESPSNMWSESHLNFNKESNRSLHRDKKSHHSKHFVPNRIQSLIWADDVDSLSSLEDIVSIGSLVSSTAESWTNQHARDIRNGLLLSLSDLFGKVNVEAHAHGHVGRTRPMASMTRLDVLLESENGIDGCRDQKLGDVNKTQIHHTSSLPDILEGEADFVEDLPKAADDLTHRMSLVYLDLENDDDERSPHVINGHVMLLTREQLRLQKNVKDLRKTRLDERLQYKVASEKHKTGNETTKKKRSWSKTTSKPQHKKHSTLGRVHGARNKGLSIFVGAQRKFSIVREASEDDHIDSWHDIEPDKLAEELTAIDADLFLRIHEAELVQCTWMKGECHFRAKNVMAVIEFFKKVAGMVAHEVLQPETAVERANVLAHILKVAHYLKDRHNFHSLRAILAGLQLPAVFRLRETWTLLEEQLTDQYKIWTDLLDHADLECRSLMNDPDLDRAMRAPPCLPFLGSILMRIIDFYALEDISGTRVAHKLHQQACQKRQEVDERSTASSETETAIEIVEGHALPDDGDAEIEKDNHRKDVPKLLHFWKKITTRFDDVAPKHSLKITSASSAHADIEATPSEQANDSGGMGAQRRQHIQRLILEYAQHLAEEEDRALFMSYARTPRRSGAGADMIGVDSTTRARLLEEFMAATGDDGSDAEPSRSRHFEELHQMAHAHDDMPWKHQWSSEFCLHQTLLRFQLAAVQFEPRERNHKVREYLLQESSKLPSGVELFKLSLDREPPEWPFQDDFAT